MNNKKELKSTNSRLIQRLPWVLIVTIGIISFGCHREEAADEYYVKYEVSSFTTSYTIHATVNNEKNNDMSFPVTDTQWETIIGPVQKGFNASLGVVVDGAQIVIHLKIYVSKNDSPFAIKANDSSKTGRPSAQLSYTIDY